jgi:methylated-DNA-[protein]-cysteine S-methyltransferase
MTSKLNYVVFNVGVGWLGILGSIKGLVSTTLPQPSAQEARRQLSYRVNQATLSPQLFRDLMGRLRLYFSGQKVDFPDELDLSAATPFQRKVWEITRLIPYGETRSYRWVAEQIGRPEAVRAVGRTLSKNPLPIIIPCHRVLTIDGKLGGYHGGVEMKRDLISLEASGRDKGAFIR